MASRVLHLVDRLDLFGEGSHLQRLLPHLATDEGHRLLTLRGHPGAISNLPAASLNVRWSRDPLAWFRLRRHLRHDPPNIVHAWDTSSLAWLLAALPSRSAARVVATLSRTTPLPPRLAVRGARLVDRWIATSHAARDAAIAAGLPAGRGITLPRGATPPSGEFTSRQQVLERWGLPLDAPLIATASSLQHEARLKELIWAADMVRVLHPRLRLVIVGEGPARRGLEYFARTAAVPENIVLAGSRDPFELLPHARVYWTGSETGETHGTLIDAMACGVPVVASDVPLHREWIDHGKQGYLVGLTARADRTRATDQLLSDEPLYRRVSDAARERAAAEHSLANEVEGFMQLYREWND